MRAPTLAAALVAVASTLDSAPSLAAGPFVTDRGVRPLGRGGAFVAGADDLGAIWYNPAGIVDAPASLLVDASWVSYQASFTRQTLSTSATGTTFVESLPTVSGSGGFIPIPTIAASFKFGARREYAVAFGAYAPYVPTATFPQTLTNPDGSTSGAPQRYTLISLAGSALVVLGAWFAWRPDETLRIGGGAQLLTGTYQSTVDFSACPQDNLVCAAEDPSYDALTEMKMGPIFAPSGNLGIIWAPSRYVRFGASGQAPFWLSSDATVQTRLPTAVVFDNASEQGNSAHVSFEIPPVVRAGVEVRPFGHRHLRVELAWVREFLSAYSAINIRTNIALENVTGFPTPFHVPPLSIPLGGQDADSFRLGGEIDTRVGGVYLQGRAGISYETSGIQHAYVSVLGIDGPKWITSLGGSLYVDRHWRLDAVYAHVFLGDVTVTPQEAALTPVNPVQGNPTPVPAVNGGTYHADTNVIGLGMQYAF
jgi:long-chain fatty acid transport protein